MGTMKQFASRHDLSSGKLCTNILDRHRETIRVQKPHVAVGNLIRIVDATLALSNKQGFHATTLRDLARASELSMGALYSYFDSKETLLMMVLGEVSTAVNEVLGNPPAEVQRDPVDNLGWLIENHIYLTEAMLPWFVFAYLEAKSFPKVARDVATNSELQTEKMFADVLARGARTGSFVTDDPLLTASLIKPLLQDWYVKRSKYRRRDVSPEAFVHMVTDFVGTAIQMRQPVRAAS